jgi:CBS domain-containing protein
MLKVGDVLRSKGTEIFSISPKETVYRALELLAEHDIGALLVIEDGELVGIFSERDYARKVILKGRSSKDTPVGELMTTKVYSITTDKTIEECMALMTTTRSRHMPVFENNKLVGVVSIGDIVNAIINEQRITIQDLENYITGSEYVQTSG